MKKLLWVCISSAALAFAGCGDDDDDNNNNNNNETCTPVTATISGTLDVHPISLGINTVGGTVAPSVGWGAAGEVTISLIDPADVVAQVLSPTILGQVTDVSACVPGAACAVEFTDVNLCKLSIGLVAIIHDTRATPDFVTTNVGIMSQNSVNAVKADTAAGYPTAVFYAVTDQSVTTMGMYTGGSPTGAEMLANGMLFGMMLNNATPIPAPVADVTVSATHAAIETIGYPTADLTGAGAATSATGFFFAAAAVAAGASPAAVVSNWDATGTGSETWASLLAGTNPNSVFVLLWKAD